MNYELAKELKDAGFPQSEPNGFPGILNPDGDTTVYYPTLEELIEACGDSSISLAKWGKKWQAGYHDKWGECNGPEGSGETPEEAVANLWLAINKK